MTDVYGSIRGATHGWGTAKTTPAPAQAPSSLGSAPALRVAALAVRALPRRMWHAAPHDGSTLKPLSGPVLLAYARYLNLNQETEPELLHVAREALTDALPLGWERHLDATHNMPFFYCHNGGFTSWQHPQLNHYLAKIEMLRRPAARPQHKPRQSQYSPRQPSPHAAAPPQYEQYRQQAAAAAGGGVRSGLPTASARCADGRPPHIPSPQHSPAPRHSPAPSASRSSFGGGGGGSSSCSSCSDGAARQPGGVARQASPSWEERWRRQQVGAIALFTEKRVLQYVSTARSSACDGHERCSDDLLRMPG